MSEERVRAPSTFGDLLPPLTLLLEPYVSKRARTHRRREGGGGEGGRERDRARETDRERNTA